MWEKKGNSNKPEIIRNQCTKQRPASFMEKKTKQGINTVKKFPIHFTQKSKEKNILRPLIYLFPWQLSTFYPKLSLLHCKKKKTYMKIFILFLWYLYLNTFCKRAPCSCHWIEGMLAVCDLPRYWGDVCLTPGFRRIHTIDFSPFNLEAKYDPR